MCVIAVCTIPSVDSPGASVVPSTDSGDSVISDTFSVVVDTLADESDVKGTGDK